MLSPLSLPSPPVGARGGGGLSGVFLDAFPLTADATDRALVIAGGGGSSGHDCDLGGPGNHLTEAGGEPTMAGGGGDRSDENGGGGGYRGGAGGEGDGAANGGKGFVSSITLDATEYSIYAANLGDVDPPMNGDRDWDGVAGKSESRGLVVIHFVCHRPPQL